MTWEITEQWPAGFAGPAGEYGLIWNIKVVTDFVGEFWLHVNENQVRDLEDMLMIVESELDRRYATVLAVEAHCTHD